MQLKFICIAIEFAIWHNIHSFFSSVPQPAHVEESIGPSSYEAR